jgi:hypothetical protein
MFAGAYLVMMRSDFLDETGHQIPVEFEQQRLIKRVFSAAKGILG